MDVRSAVAVWRAHPYLPLLTTALWIAESVRLWPVVVVALLVRAGWPGVERIWYLRAFDGATVEPGEVVRFWRAFFWRFVRLGLVVATPWVVVFAVLRPHATTQRLLAMLAVFSIIVDFGLTFVTPALTFSTRRVTVALRLGLRTIRQEWPRCALYVLAPPLALETLLGLGWIVPRGSVASYALSGIAVVAGLAFKGATAAFFLRRYPSGRDGAAWQDALVAMPEPHLLPPPPSPIVRRPPKGVRRRRPNAS